MKVKDIWCCKSQPTHGCRVGPKQLASPFSGCRNKVPPKSHSWCHTIHRASTPWTCLGRAELSPAFSCHFLPEKYVFEGHCSLCLIPMQPHPSSWMALVLFSWLKQRRDVSWKHSLPGPYLSGVDLLGNSCFKVLGSGLVWQRSYSEKNGIVI